MNIEDLLNDDRFISAVADRITELSAARRGPKSDLLTKQVLAIQAAATKAVLPAELTPKPEDGSVPSAVLDLASLESSRIAMRHAVRSADLLERRLARLEEFAGLSPLE